MLKRQRKSDEEEAEEKINIIAISDRYKLIGKESGSEKNERKRKIKYWQCVPFLKCSGFIFYYFLTCTNMIFVVIVVARI